MLGVNTYGAFKAKHFILHATLFWIINDLPAYDMLFGWSIKEALASQFAIKIHNHIILFVKVRIATQDIEDF